MKTFKLKSIEYKNIMSVGDEPIYVALDAVHKTLITGQNGGGKSTLLEALTFLLFGKPFRDIKKGQLINSTNKKDMWVQGVLEFNGSEFTITRGQKPGIFEVLKDGEPLSAAASVRDFQQEFEDMIGMNYNSFKQVVVLGTAGYTPFMGLHPGGRRRLVEDLLEITILAEMDRLNKEQVRDVNTKIQQNDLSITHIQTQIRTHQEYAERQQKLSGDNVDRFQKMYDECVEKVKGYRDKNLDLSSSILNVDLPPDVSADLSAATRKSVEIEGEKNTITRVLDLYQKGGSCPTCLQELHYDNGILGDMKTNRTALEAELEELIQVRNDLVARKKELFDRNSEISKIENQINANKQLAAQEIDKAKKITSLLNEAKKEVIDNSGEISKLTDELNQKVNVKTDLVDEKKNRLIISEMLKDGGIKGAIIKKYIPLFNKQINHYLGLLEADYSFTLNEEFSETIKSRGREEFSYASFSQGEKGRIDLALMFTWRDIAEKVSGIKISCLFLDEVFDGAFDAAATKSVTTILNTMSDSNIFIISHRDHNPQDYGQHLHMKKVGRFTVMEKS